MTTQTDPSGLDIDITCSLSASERVERGGDFERLFAHAQGIAELTDGYAMKFPNDDVWISQAAALIVAERKCCPFFGFTLVFEPNEGPVWLYIVGSEDVKEFVRAQVLPPHLRPTA